MSLGLIAFLMIVFVANVVIGYVVAILIGFGPSDLGTAWAHIQRFPWIARFQHVIRLGKQNGANRFTSFFDRYKAVRHRTPDAPKPPVDETTEAKLERIAAKDVREYLEDESAEITRITPVPELFDDNLMNIIFEKGTEIWLVTDKHIETSIHKLNLMMMSSGRFAGELDRKLRSMQDSISLEEVRRMCQNLADDCRNYLENQSKITTDIHSRVEEFGELRNLAEAIDQSNLDQASQIELTLSNLSQLEQVDNITGVVTSLIQELANLRTARHNTRDIQDRAFVAIARSENRMGSINRTETFTDQATGLNNSIAFQTHLWEWWQQDRHKKTKLTFALYDIVGFTELNHRIGIQTCDKILPALVQWIDKRLEGRDFIGLYSGNCLVSVSSNSSLRKTIAFVERIRQEAEHTELILNDRLRDVAIHLTCAVTEATDKQSETDVINILDQTLAAAKRAGRNLTYQYDPAKINPVPEAVESLELTVQDRIFDLASMQFSGDV